VDQNVFPTELFPSVEAEDQSDWVVEDNQFSVFEMQAAAEEHVEAKRLTLLRRHQQVALVTRIVDSMSEEGELPPRGCGLCALLRNRWRSRATNGSHVAVNGSAASSTKTATQQRLESAGVAMRARADALATKLDSQRAEAMRLSKAGKKAEALAMLRRSKATEKQFQTATGTVETLEAQISMMEDAKLQQEVSTALAASVKSVKKGTKGLLDRTEKAVDESHEVRDLTDDMHSALEGLKPADAMDDDELLDELEQMMADDDQPPPSAAVSANGCSHTKSSQESTNNDAEGIELDIRQFPSAPTSKAVVRNGGGKGVSKASGEGERVQLLASQA
jgi:hypothetical protein